MPSQLNNTLTAFTEKLVETPDLIEFNEVIALIDKFYRYEPVSFVNGELRNEAGTNEGSCKIFYFAQLNELTEQQTLSCFGHYYRDDVLKNLDGDDHANIRNFIKTGWAQLMFDNVALLPTTA